jgi:hypothetical protein
MISAAMAASSACEMALVAYTYASWVLRSRNEKCLSKGGIHLILCLALLCACFLKLPSV